MIHGNLARLQTALSPDGLLKAQDLTQIVASSRLWPQPPASLKPIQKEVVEINGNRYKVRVYPNAETAQRQWEYLTEIKATLFARCHGRIGRYLVLDYIPDGNSNGSVPTPHEIGLFLTALAKEQTRASIKEDFDSWCTYIGNARIFLPRTIELFRRYHRLKLESLPVSSGLEYYDATPHNFITMGGGKLLAFDEKHLDVGPRGVSLVRPEHTMTAKDWSDTKETYSLKMGSAALLEDSEYRDFLRFYWCKRQIYWWSYRVAVGTDTKKMLRFKRELLTIIRRSRACSLRDKLSWELDYQYSGPWRVRLRVAIPRSRPNS